MQDGFEHRFFPWTPGPVPAWHQEVVLPDLDLILDVCLREDGWMYIGQRRNQDLTQYQLRPATFVDLQTVATPRQATHYARDMWGRLESRTMNALEVTFSFQASEDPALQAAQVKAQDDATPPYGHYGHHVPRMTGSHLQTRHDGRYTVAVPLEPVDKGSLELPISTSTDYPRIVSVQFQVGRYPLIHHQRVSSPRDLIVLAHKFPSEGFRAWYLNHAFELDLSGVKKVEALPAVAATLQRLQSEEPLLHRFFVTLHDGRTFEKTSNNRLLAATLTAIGADYNLLKAELQTQLERVFQGIWDVSYYSMSRDHFGYARSVCLALPGAKDKVEAEKAKAQWQFAKSVRAQAEVLGISPTRHPNLLARVESNAFPMSLFHERGNEDKLVNIEFDLWEKALSRPGWGDAIAQIAASASKRSTFSKRVTSYFAFLFRIEKYLDRNAPRKGGKKNGWKAIPKFVNSQWELEMDEATEEGTTKRRSALTPVADNEAGTITVPYASLRVSGVQTTYCYSEVYFVAEEGAEDPIFEAGGVYSADVKEKLNGRDDYGLCFYTLTGTSRNQGYPTFLVIFERTNAHGTRVHFHRVHPSRSRGPNGTATPPDRLIEECYRYMAGNIRAEEIKHQQGDLLLIPVAEPGKAVIEPVEVRGFENHSFESRGERPVTLFRTKAKAPGNLLGYLMAPDGMRMPHPEHEPIEDIEPGCYELRRVKSWEANPTSVWVLNID